MATIIAQETAANGEILVIFDRAGGVCGGRFNRYALRGFDPRETIASDDRTTNSYGNLAAARKALAFNLRLARKG